MIRPLARTGAGHGAMGSKRLADRQTGGTAFYGERGFRNDDLRLLGGGARRTPRRGRLR
jgi:hypothetical protein